MQSEVPWFPLEEIVEDILDRRGITPLKLGGEFSPAGHRVISAKVVKGGRVQLDADEPRYVNESIYQKWMRTPLRRGDVVMTSEAPLGELAFIDKDVDWVLGQRLFAIRPKPGRLHGRFLYYALQTENVRADIFGRASGTTVQGIRQSELRRVQIPLPNFVTQIEVADLLGSLDDRIDLLRQTNATLESIAQALFKSWFIDFDPVRAKADGREPGGMDAATAALFPAEFEDSAIGPIPKGWSVGILGEHVLAERGLSYKGAGLCGVGEGLPMHNLNSVLEGGGYKYAGIKHYSGDYKERHIATAGDIIVANTEQGHEHRLIGFPAIVPEKYHRAIYSHHLYRVRVKADSPLTTHTLYYTLMAPSVREQIIGCANGSTVNMLKIAGLEIPRFACSTASVSGAFEDLARPLRRQIEANVDRSEVLAALRDTLLPRLISGRLRLPEAEAAIEAVA
jgi:type I restriction enzyme S subunit